MADVSRINKWQPLPSDVADWMGSVEDSDVTGRPADAAEPVDLLPVRGLGARLWRVLSPERPEKRAS